MRTTTPLSLGNLDLWDQQNSQTIPNSQLLQLLEERTTQTQRALALVITVDIIWIDSHWTGKEGDNKPGQEKEPMGGAQQVVVEPTTTQDRGGGGVLTE